MELCPHCGGMTTSEASRPLRWICGACGGARVPGVKTGRVTTAKLAAAKKELTKHWSGLLMAAILLGMALLVAFVALVAAATAHGAAAFGAAALGAIDFALAVAAWGYAKKRAAASRDQLDDAWADVAARFARSHGGEVTAPVLASALKTSQADAEAILTKLSTAGARVEIDDDAELHYRVEGGDARSSDAGDDAEASASATNQGESR